MKYASLLLLVMLMITGCDKDNPDPVGDRNDFHTRIVGASAGELLTDAKFKSLKISVQYMHGFAPDGAALAQLETFLESRLNKPGGITIQTEHTVSASNTTMSADDVRTFETANRTNYSTDDVLAVNILYTNGVYTDNNVLGIAYRNTSVAIFGKTIYDNSGGIGQASRTKLEANVLIHELGHLLGLVDLGTPMQTPHKDGAHGSHCDNSGCIMYYASETTDILGFLLTGNVPPLDANCVNDLKAAGGK